jgi:hypothetical protein
MTYVTTTHKFVAVLNKKIPQGKVMNALAHATAGLAGSYPNKEQMRFGDYIDQDQTTHSSISDNPFIILRADNSNKLRALRNAAKEANIQCVDFTDTMTVGTYAEQQVRTKETPEAELEYYAVVLFGAASEIEPLTKKFSLWPSN